MKVEKIKITPAKCRPMLHWFGKRPLDYVKGFSCQLVEVFLPAEVSAQAGDPLRKLSLRGEKRNMCRICKPYKYVLSNNHSEEMLLVAE